MKIPKKSLYLLAALLFASSSNITSANTIQQITGDNRFETANFISDSGWSNGSENVILINSTSISDALSASSYAKKLNAPILLTSSEKLNSQTKNQLKKLKTKKVVIIGGTNSISNNIESNLKSEGFETERISSQNKYDTSINIAKKVGLNNEKELIVVNGNTSLSDAVGISPVSSKLNIPIIFTNGSDLKTFKQVVNTLNAEKIYFIGGLNSIPSSFENAFENSKTISVERISGENRSNTNAKIIDKFYNKNLPLVYFAKDGQNNSDELIDSVALSPLAGKKKAPIVLVNKNLKISNEQKNVLKNKKSNNFVAVGGKVINAINNLTFSKNNSKKIIKPEKVKVEVPYYVKAITDTSLDQPSDVSLAISTKWLANGDDYKNSISSVKDQDGNDVSYSITSNDEGFVLVLDKQNFTFGQSTSVTISSSDFKDKTFVVSVKPEKVKVEVPYYVKAITDTSLDQPSDVSLAISTKWLANGDDYKNSISSVKDQDGNDVSYSITSNDEGFVLVLDKQNFKFGQSTSVTISSSDFKDKTFVVSLK